MCTSYLTSPGISELIDTLWNVNVDCAVVYRHVNRINRYIMECKFTTRIPPQLILITELIDTLWNVN